MSGWGRVERRDAEIWYFDTDTDLPLVVLLHGLAGHAQEWRTTIDALDEEHRLVAIEQRGHGTSTRRPDDVSRAAYVGDVLAVLDDLGVDAAPLVGQSMGGHTAMLVAAAAPDRVTRLLMAESSLGGEPASATRAVTDWLSSWPAPFVDLEDFVMFFGGDPVVAHAWSAGLERRADGWWPSWDSATLGRALAAVHERECLAEWASVTAPTLLVRGEHGSVTERQVDTMKAVRPGLAVTTVAGAGHDLHLQSPESWIRVLRGFLRG